MKKFMHWLEISAAPRMNKINNYIWIQTLKDSMMQILPMIFVGSLITIISILQDYIPWMPDLSGLSSFSIGIVGMLVAFLIPFNFMEHKNLHQLRLVASMTGLGMYLMIAHLENPDLFIFDTLGAGGMFVAIVVGIYVGLIFNLFGKFSFFKEDSSMPDFVRAWFDNMIPVLICLVTVWIFVGLLGVDVYSLINAALSPLVNFSQSIFGFTLIYFLLCFLYTMGISTWLLYSFTYPIMLSAIMANSAAVAAGGHATNIFTSEVMFSGWLAFGGTGGTLLLCILFLFASSRRLKAIGRAAIFPSMLNINEPIVFGAVAWNPILMIPMWIHGLVTPIITYLWLSVGWAAIPHDLFGFWYCPFPFSTWLVSRSVGGLILLVIVLAVTLLIYYPFFKVYDKQQAKEEAEKAAAKAAKQAAVVAG